MGTECSQITRKRFRFQRYDAIKSSWDRSCSCSAREPHLTFHNTAEYYHSVFISRDTKSRTTPVVAACVRYTTDDQMSMASHRFRHPLPINGFRNTGLDCQCVTETFKRCWVGLCNYIVCTQVESDQIDSFVTYASLVRDYQGYRHNYILLLHNYWGSGGVDKEEKSEWPTQTNTIKRVKWCGDHRITTTRLTYL